MTNNIIKTSLIAIMIVLSIVLCNDYYTIITTASHNWAWYMSHRKDIAVELFTLSFLLSICIMLI